MIENKSKDRDAGSFINTEQSSEQSESDEESEDEIEKLLKSKEKERLENHNTVSESERHLSKVITSFLKAPRVKHSKCKNVLAYWSSQKLQMPLLHLLSENALSVPATQVSVERLFSVLKLVLSDQRSNLSEEMCNDIMFIRCNDIFKS